MKEKKDFSNVGTSICSVLFILLALIELQIMVNYPEKFIWFVGVGALILIDVYFLIAMGIKKKGLSQQKKEEQLEAIQKSEKASYLLIKKNFQDMEERLAKLERTVAPVSSTIDLSGQKVENAVAESMLENRKVAKILLGRSKESAEAMIDGHQDIRNSVENMEDKLAQLEQQISILNTTPVETDSRLNLEQYQEILSGLRNLESSIKKQVEETVKASHKELEAAIAVRQESARAYGVPITEAVPEQELLPESEELDDLNLSKESDFEPESVTVEAEPEVVPEAVTMEPAITEPEPAAVSEAVPEPEIPDPNKMMSTDDIAALLASMGTDAAAPEPEPIPEPEVVSEPEIPMPEIPDPNKMMSTDDIAALLASMGTDAAAPEPEPNPEPEVVPEPAATAGADSGSMMTPDEIAALLESVGTGDSVSDSEMDDLDTLAGLDALMDDTESAAEAKVPMPDMSDPNHVMTPDEIAALLANL